MIRSKCVIKRLTISLIILSSCLLLISDIAYAVRRPVRSVYQCDRHSAVVPAFTDDKSCRKHCEETYINSQSRQWRSANKNMLQANIKLHIEDDDTTSIGRRVHLQHQQRQQQQQQQQQQGLQPQPQQGELECCCSFEAPWPQYVRREAIGREHDVALSNEKLLEMTRGTCLPIVMSIGLSHRTRASYETLCRYLNFQRNPTLTILELMQFAEAAAYLNYMKPKHPAILLVLRQKRVQRIQKLEVQELRAALYDYLLDETYNKQLVELPGYKISIARFKKLLDAKRALSNALKVDTIYRAFEELAISQVLVDVAALSYRLQELNVREFRVPRNVLIGEYDKYDTDLSSYFTVSHALNCPLLAQTRNKVSIYLSTMRSLLDPFREKGLYNHMSQKYQSLIDILHTQKIYGNLLAVNCAKSGR